MKKIGIIGCGFIGMEHIKGLRKAGAEVIAASSPFAEQREKIQKEFAIQHLFANSKDMIDNIKLDAVSICTPNFLHKSDSIYALQHGINVLCEKPMALNANEALEMLICEKKSKKLLMMGFNQIFDQGLQAIITMNKNDEFGEIYHAKASQVRIIGNHSSQQAGAWFVKKEYSGAGASVDLGSHAFYRAWYAMGKPKPVSAKCYRKFISGDVDDFAAAFIRFENNKTLELEVGWETSRFDAGVTTLIMGTKASAFFNRDKNELVITRRSKNEMTKDVLISENITDKYVHFIACLEKGIGCVCSALDGYIVQAVLDALILSSEKNFEVKIDQQGVI